MPPDVCVKCGRAVDDHRFFKNDKRATWYNKHEALDPPQCPKKVAA